MFNRLLRSAGRARAPVAAPVPTDVKASRAAALIAFGAERPRWGRRDYEGLARAGFRSNPVVHACVRRIAESTAAIPMVLYEGDAEINVHPVVSMLARPNPRQGGQALFEMIYSHLLISGNAYVEQVGLGQRPRELYALRPDRMTPVPGPNGWAEAYDYAVGERRTRFYQEGATPPILHLTIADPMDDHRGVAPIEAAADALETHNAATAWTKALLDNAARPSGALVYAGPDGAGLSEAQYERLKAELEESFQGARNAGRPLLLDGGLDWKPLSLSPREMDFAEAKSAAAREIALAFGVPPLLLGLPGDNTHANYAEANRAFHRQTVLPLARRTAQSLIAWLSPAFGDRPLRLEPDLDRVEALSTERAALWEQVNAASFLTEAEKRVAVGWDGGARRLR